MSVRQATFTSMTQGTQADWDAIAAAHHEQVRGLADRMLDHLKELRGGLGGFAVDRYEHSLQSATRALRDGRDEEYVVCALLHDIGDLLGPHNHAEIAAVMLKPFVSERNHWMLEHHGIFQGYYFWHFLGMDRDAREAYRDSPYFEYTREFCEKYDQNAFDPNYDTLPLETFEPMVRKLLAAPRR